MGLLFFMPFEPYSPLQISQSSIFALLQRQVLNFRGMNAIMEQNILFVRHGRQKTGANGDE